MRDRDYKMATKELNEFSAWAKEQRRNPKREEQIRNAFWGLFAAILEFKHEIEKPINHHNFKYEGITSDAFDPYKLYRDYANLRELKLPSRGRLDGIEGILDGATA